MENIKSYIKEVRKEPLLTAKEEIDLSKRAKKGDAAARDRMIRANLRLVINIAKKYMHLGIPLMDLIEEGNVGLMKAVEKFNPKKGFRFSTYAAWWIKQGITRSVFDQSRTVRIPVYVNELLTKYKKTNERLMGKLKRVPTDTEVARVMRVTIDKITKIRSTVTKTSSLDAPIDEEGGNEIIDLVEDKSSANPETELNNFFTKERLTGLLDLVNVREHEVLNLRFGLVDGKQHTLADVSKKMGVSRERIRQIEENALKKLKKFMSEQDKEAMK
ncbi:MAG: sigma-70 family RNA polymerase sigma factor [Candidatus Omnitrophica bacterium]|nr:sigma-70 family RNA polymerase sigma factor [Candidatus Omnitrophota bacterium]